MGAGARKSLRWWSREPRRTSCIARALHLSSFVCSRPLDSPSFPSGHVVQYTVLFGFTFFLVYVLARRSPHADPCPCAAGRADRSDWTSAHVPGPALAQRRPGWLCRGSHDADSLVLGVHKVAVGRHAWSIHQSRFHREEKRCKLTTTNSVAQAARMYQVLPAPRQARHPLLLAELVLRRAARST